MRTAPGPYPPDLSRSEFERDVNADSSRILFRHARRTRAIWQYWPGPRPCQGRLPFSPNATRIGLPSASRPAATELSERLSPPLEPTAPHGALDGNRKLSLVGLPRSAQFQLPSTILHACAIVGLRGKPEPDNGAYPRWWSALFSAGVLSLYDSASEFAGPSCLAEELA